MPSSVQNIGAVARIYPYVSPVQPGESTDMATFTTAVNIPIFPPPPVLPKPPAPIPPVKPSGELEWSKFSLSTPDVSNVTKAIGTITSTLEKLVNFITPVLDIIQLFLNNFNSFASVLNSMFKLIDRLLDKAGEMTKGTGGAYLNIIVPPALMNANTGNFNIMKLASGGYQGFLGRLNASFYDVTDVQRPPFQPTDVVGGFIIMVDADTADEFFKTLNQLSQIFDLTKLFGLDTAPPPPKHLKGTSGLYDVEVDKKVTQKFGIKLEWKGAPYPTSYAVFRSTIPGGKPEYVNYHPTKLNGKDGLFATVARAIFKGEPWPKVPVKSYLDPTFNKGKPKYILPNQPDGGAVFIDIDIPCDDTGVPGVFKPNKDTPPAYYYVVRSVMGPMVGTNTFLDQGWVPNVGPRSNQAKVAVKFCDDSAEAAAVIEHSSGGFELLAPGWGGFGRWTSMQATVILPFLPDIIIILKKMLKNLSGMAANSSDAFSKFIKQIKEKIMLYVNTINLINQLLTELLGFAITGSAAFLYVPAKTGGLPGFMKRVRNATIPPGTAVVTDTTITKNTAVVSVGDVSTAPVTTQQKNTTVSTEASKGFSGPGGMTLGIVIMVGMTGYEQQGAEVEAAFKAVNKSWDALTAMLGKPKKGS